MDRRPNDAPTPANLFERQVEALAARLRGPLRAVLVAQLADGAVAGWLDAARAVLGDLAGRPAATPSESDGGSLALQLRGLLSGPADGADDRLEAESRAFARQFARRVLGRWLADLAAAARPGDEGVPLNAGGLPAGSGFARLLARIDLAAYGLPFPLVLDALRGHALDWVGDTEAPVPLVPGLVVRRTPGDVGAPYRLFVDEESAGRAVPAAPLVPAALWRERYAWIVEAVWTGLPDSRAWRSDDALAATSAAARALRAAAAASDARREDPVARVLRDPAALAWREAVALGVDNFRAAVTSRDRGTMWRLARPVLLRDRLSEAARRRGVSMAVATHWYAVMVIAALEAAAPGVAESTDLASMDALLAAFGLDEDRAAALRRDAVDGLSG